jgi:hypothetical protein
MPRNNKNKAKKKDKLGNANRNSTISPSCSECRQQHQHQQLKRRHSNCRWKRSILHHLKIKLSWEDTWNVQATAHRIRRSHTIFRVAAVYRQAIGLKPPAVGLFFRESGNNKSQPKHGLFFHAGLGFSNPFFKKTWKWLERVNKYSQDNAFHHCVVFVCAFWRSWKFPKS